MATNREVADLLARWLRARERLLTVPAAWAALCPEIKPEVVALIDAEIREILDAAACQMLDALWPPKRTGRA